MNSLTEVNIPSFPRHIPGCGGMPHDCRDYYHGMSGDLPTSKDGFELFLTLRRK